MPRMIEDTTQPPEQPMQASEKAYEIVWCGEAHDGIDFADVVEMTQCNEGYHERAYDVLARLSDVHCMNEVHVRRLRREANEMFEEVAVKMLEDKA